MSRIQVIETAAGPVEVAYRPGARQTVLFFPGGHCAAASECGANLYTSLGHGVVSFSRPGYGRTSVGPMTASEFVPAVAECCKKLGVDTLAAAVGVSFGGLQAIHAAIGLQDLVPKLILHSCAPSTHAYPDSTVQRRIAPLVFSPVIQRLTWASIARVVSTDYGLKAMARSLSELPIKRWWHLWSAEDKNEARQLFQSMDSGSGFVNDLHQATAALTASRRYSQTQVPCPTLVTASRLDGGVAFTHAQDFAATIPHVRLVESDAPSHLFWLGRSGDQMRNVIAMFLQ